MEVEKENLQMMGKYASLLTLWKVRYVLKLVNLQSGVLLSHFTDEPTKTQKEAWTHPMWQCLLTSGRANSGIQAFWFPSQCTSSPVMSHQSTLHLSYYSLFRQPPGWFLIEDKMSRLDISSQGGICIQKTEEWQMFVSALALLSGQAGKITT